jgi:hypothetical protein
MNDISPVTGGDIIESVITKGDLAKLTPAERTRYYVEVCRSVGINPMTQPFQYITLNGRLTLYAAKGCTDQLRTSRGVSVEDMVDSERDGVFVVTCKVRDRDGRTDMAKGAVPIGGLKGEALANAIMKAETKAKRRATLSLCGLGLLDESELETIPASVLEPAPAPRLPANGNGAPKPPAPLPQEPAPPEVHDPETGEVGPHLIPVLQSQLGKADWIGWGGKLVVALQRANTREEGEAWIRACQAALGNCERDAPKVHERVQANIRVMRERLPDFMEAVS